MTNSPIVPCIWLDDQAEAAAEFYLAAFRGGNVDAVAHYPESAPSPSGRPPGSVLTVDAYPWSERYAWVMDRFGVSWQVMAAPGVERATVAPCLMFTGPQHGRAREAIDAYVAALPGSGVEFVDAYDGAEGPAGTVKHGRFSLAEQPMVAMDSAFEHGFTFNEAVSLQVMCADQAEVDRLWATLAEGGEFGPCGWLKDRFGVSWQVVPEGLLPLLTGPDVVARDRTFAALLGMGKLDLAELRRAYDGG